ncbi:MAG: tRNA uridine(34) 5-carboxymethylaminomethyl modification radical SAM/GNAT enzyme Elp3, partial [Gammaproteobacteria bacterium]|nr:tRNA uridine(34) 5-carboxymethylaminomethyl modification radical SAM/GNAT enzyme Elp3 [Gammaproteobacteria bacterium]
MTTANPDDFRLACRELLEMVLDGTITDELQLSIQKKKISGRYQLSTLPKNADIIMAGNEDEQGCVKDTLRRKPVRTISGVAVVAVMTSP